MLKGTVQVVQPVNLKDTIVTSLTIRATNELNSIKLVSI
jgi:hypothetical protein